jgi:acetyl esterase/lipase
MKRSRGLVLTLLLLMVGREVTGYAAESQFTSPVRIDETGTVHVPALDVPLSSYMSEQAKQAFIKAASAARDTDWKSLSLSQIRALAESGLQKYLDRARALYPVNVEERRIGGVPTRLVTPKDGVAPRNRDRLLINLHGGGFFSGAGNEALLESIPVAALGKLKVVTVDYREGPENRFPAASEDTALVYGSLLKEYKPRNIGIYGCSAGGILTAMAVAWFQKHRLPTPGAIGVFGAGAFGAWYGPPSTLGSWSGDSAYTAPPLVGERPVPVDPKQAEPMPEYMSAYLRHADLTDPLVSPGLSPSVLSKFPPVLLITGTRAWDMSAAIQTQRALTNAGVEASLHLWDGMGHCFFFDVDLPESQEAFVVMTKFFDSRLVADVGT